MLDLKPMRASATQHAGRGRISRCAAHHHAALSLQHHARVPLKPLKALVRATQERHVIRVFKVRETNDAAAAMPRAAVVRRSEAINANDPHAATREFQDRG